MYRALVQKPHCPHPLPLSDQPTCSAWYPSCPERGEADRCPHPLPLSRLTDHAPHGTRRCPERGEAARGRWPGYLSTKAWAWVSAEARPILIIEYQGVHQAAWSGENGRPAANAAEYGDLLVPGRGPGLLRHRCARSVPRPPPIVGIPRGGVFPSGSAEASAWSRSASSRAKFSAGVGRVRSR